MKKQNLRSLGVGFLASSILAGAFAVFFQGHVPVDGITLPSLFEGQNTESFQEQYDKDQSTIAGLTQEKDEISRQKEEFSNQVEQLKNDNESLQEKLDEQSNLQKDQEDESVDEKEETSAEEVESNEEDTTEEVEAPEDGAFAITDGESSAEIASRLEETGYIDSASDFQELIDQWNLESVIQAGDYELSKDMSIHEIASELTNGVYYYQ
ncbi:endolytic transglycosylase MltG [Facklamia sp. DSM 111018]|uniref:Endolytic transglycosylase MltG n=1 Tax=Facklamia lactis TaxID=2749967 RepID=A0ABS0LNY5_9LACT|nr:endolytic transglycosylase MltG [Facklamia lactis]MBG9980069.1 endolytic transglycosylase MltG [Facklamia lactis]MBG9985871.1 endolytic transglycosylase MltG [Facklamia lactis]